MKKENKLPAVKNEGIFSKIKRGFSAFLAAVTFVAPASAQASEITHEDNFTTPPRIEEASGYDVSQRYNDIQKRLPQQYYKQQIAKITTQLRDKARDGDKELFDNYFTKLSPVLNSKFGDELYLKYLQNMNSNVEKGLFLGYLNDPTDIEMAVMSHEGLTVNGHADNTLKYLSIGFDKADEQQNIYILAHEMTHSFGTINLYEKTRDSQEYSFRTKLTSIISEGFATEVGLECSEAINNIQNTSVNTKYGELQTSLTRCNVKSPYQYDCLYMYTQAQTLMGGDDLINQFVSLNDNSNIDKDKKYESMLNKMNETCPQSGDKFMKLANDMISLTKDLSFSVEDRDDPKYKAILEDMAKLSVESMQYQSSQGKDITGLVENYNRNANSFLANKDFVALQNEITKTHDSKNNDFKTGLQASVNTQTPTISTNNEQKTNQDIER